MNFLYKVLFWFVYKSGKFPLAGSLTDDNHRRGCMKSQTQRPHPQRKGLCILNSSRFDVDKCAWLGTLPDSTFLRINQRPEATGTFNIISSDLPHVFGKWKCTSLNGCSSSCNTWRSSFSLCCRTMFYANYDAVFQLWCFLFCLLNMLPLSFSVPGTILKSALGSYCVLLSGLCLIRSFSASSVDTRILWSMPIWSCSTWSALLLKRWSD